MDRCTATPQTQTWPLQIFHLKNGEPTFLDAAQLARYFNRYADH
jgi:hypothetical protein